MAVSSAPNPISLDPGPDMNIRQFLHAAFERNARAGRVFDVNSWAKWTQTEVTGAIRALAQDYLAQHGAGHDWVSASFQAEVVLAATYHVVAYEAGIQPAPRMYLNFFDERMKEGFEFVMEPPLELKVDPLPGTPPPPKNDQSQRVRARLMVAPPRDCLKATDECLWTGVNQLREFFQTQSRLPLIMMAACLVVWKGFQVSHQIRGASILRGIRNTDKPLIPEGEMRLVMSRLGDHIEKGISEDPESATILLA